MKTKERIIDFIINTILIFVIILIICFIYLIISEKNETVSSLEEENVVLTSTVSENINKETIVIPIIDTESSTSKVYISNNVKNNKYYYNQLNDNAKIIYDAIEDNLENMKSGTYTIKLPNSVAKILYNENGSEELDENFQSAWDALTLDRVDIFFIDISKISLLIKKTTYGTNVSYELEITPTDESRYLEDGQNGKETVNNTLKQVQNVKEEIMSKVSGTTYNKIMKVHDWLIDNLEYDTKMTNPNIYNIYGALVEKSAVCEGYAEAFKYIMDELDIPCILVAGEAINSEGSKEKHEWNYVQIDGKWYGVDVTWDDPIINGYAYVTNSTRHKYLLKGSITMDKNHKAIGKLSAKGKEFIYPELQMEDY